MFTLQFYYPSAAPGISAYSLTQEVPIGMSYKNGIRERGISQREEPAKISKQAVLYLIPPVPRVLYCSSGFGFICIKLLFLTEILQTSTEPRKANTGVCLIVFLILKAATLFTAASVEPPPGRSGVT